MWPNRRSDELARKNVELQASVKSLQERNDKLQADYEKRLEEYNTNLKKYDTALEDSLVIAREYLQLLTELNTAATDASSSNNESPVKLVSDVKKAVSARYEDIINSQKAKHAANMASQKAKHAYDVNNLQQRATRYAVLGGGGAATGALAGLSFSLLNKKQRNNKLRNTLIGGGIGLLGGGLAAALINYDKSHGNEPALVDISKMSI